MSHWYTGVAKDTPVTATAAPRATTSAVRRATGMKNAGGRVTGALRALYWARPRRVTPVPSTLGRDARTSRGGELPRCPSFRAGARSSPRGGHVALVHAAA